MLFVQNHFLYSKSALFAYNKLACFAFFSAMGSVFWYYMVPFVRDLMFCALQGHVKDLFM